MSAATVSRVQPALRLVEARVGDQQLPSAMKQTGIQPHPSLIALVRLLAKQAAAEFLAGQQSGPSMEGQAA